MSYPFVPFFHSFLLRYLLRFSYILCFFLARGIFSALSLLIGAVCGIYWRVSKRTNSVFMAFGAGALLFALSNEIYGHALCEYEVLDEKDMLPMIMLALGSTFGAIFFSISNYLVETRGAIFRAIEWRNEWVAEVVRSTRRCCRRIKPNKGDGSDPALANDGGATDIEEGKDSSDPEDGQATPPLPTVTTSEERAAENEDVPLLHNRYRSVSNAQSTTSHLSAAHQSYHHHHPIHHSATPPNERRTPLQISICRPRN